MYANCKSQSQGNPDQNLYIQETISGQASSNIADKLWEGYKRILTYPADSIGLERKFGIALYLLNLSIAIGLIVLTLTRPHDAYSESKLEYFPKLNNFQSPDIIICPRANKNSEEYEFRVNYDYNSIDELMMPVSAVNALTRLKFKACPNEGECWDLNSECGHDLQQYCEKLNAVFEENHRLQPEKREVCSLNDLAFNLWMDNNRTVTLEIMFLKIRGDTFVAFPHCGKASWFSKRKCYMASGQRCYANATLIWFKKSFCTHVPGFPLERADWSFIYLYGFYEEFDYWIGNIETQKVRMSYTTEKNEGNMSLALGDTSVYAKFLDYEIVEISDESIESKTCLSQSHVRGLNVPCASTYGNSTSRLYFKAHISHDKYPSMFRLRNQLIHLERKMKQTIVIKRAMTGYTRFQLITSLFSCFVGHSFLQLLYLIAGACRARSLLKLRKILGVVTIFILIGVTIFMGHKDLSFYYSNRYISVRDEQTPVEQYPVFEFRLTGVMLPHSFINITKIEEYNVSLEFYSYLRLMSFQSDPVSPGIYKMSETNNSNGTTCRNIQFPQWVVQNLKTGTKATNNCTLTRRPREMADPLLGFMEYSRDPFTPSQELQKLAASNSLDLNYQMKMSRDIRREARRLADALGYKAVVSLSELAHNFLLSPSRMLTNCKFGEIHMDCWRYGHFYRRPENSMVFALRLPKNSTKSISKNLMMIGWNSPMTFSLNVTEYLIHGLKNYFGPNVGKISDYSELESTERRWKRYGTRTVLRALTEISMPGRRWISGETASVTEMRYGVTAKFSSSQIQVRSDIRKRERPGNDCFEESERLCSNPVEDVNMVYLSVQLWEWCGCIECPHGWSSHPMTRVIRQILRSSPKCCTVNHLTSCYTKHLLETQNSSDNRTGKTSWYVRFFINRGIYIPDNKLSDLNDWSTLSKEKMNALIRGYGEFDSRTQDELMRFTKQCFWRPCKKFELVQTKQYVGESTNGLLNFAFNYESSYAQGIKEVDRSHPIEFLGVLTCSYSLVFGIGLIGILEIVIGLCARTGTRGKLARRQLSHHLIKTMSFWFSDSKNAEPANSSRIEGIPKHSKTGEQRMSQIENSPSDLTSSNRMYCGPVENPVKLETVKSLRRNEKGYVMLVILLLSTAFMTGTIITYFNWIEKEEIIEEIIESPNIKPPSVMICTETHSYAQHVFDILKRSNCSINEISNSSSCDTIFNVYWKKEDGHYCFISDSINSRRRNLNTTQKDLVITSPEVFPKSFITIFGIGRNQNKRQEFEFTGKSMKALYHVKIRRNERDCPETEKPRRVEKCSLDFMARDPHLCSLHESENINPAIFSTSDSVVSGGCESYELDVSISYYNPVVNDHIKQFLVIAPHQDFAIVTTVKPKYSRVVLLSIIGSFIGSFVELTIMNGFSVLAFMLIGIFKLCKRLA